MGKKRIIKKSGCGMDQGRKERALGKAVKKRLERGVLHVEATFNNTKVVLTDESGNAIMSSSAGALGFSGARKSTAPKSSARKTAARKSASRKTASRKTARKSGARKTARKSSAKRAS